MCARKGLQGSSFGIHAMIAMHSATDGHDGDDEMHDLWFRVDDFSVDVAAARLWTETGRRYCIIALHCSDEV